MTAPSSTHRRAEAPNIDEIDWFGGPGLAWAARRSPLFLHRLDPLPVKARLALEGRSMQDLLTEYLRDWLGAD